MEKLKYQIDKYINSEGLLKTPAIYIKLLFNNIFNNIDSVNNNTNERIDNIKYCKNITYSELVSLRDNSKLIPGQLYRITDYITTTVQEGTQSANHQFDIIVTADSENVLNENARAIQHESENEGYNENIYNDDNLENDFFVEWGMATEPNTGEDILCIYKTDVTGLDPDSEDFNSDYEGTDYGDVFFYKGNYEYNREQFDVWLKYEYGDSEDGYYFQENCLHYYLTTPIVENGLIKPELYDVDTLLFYEPFTAEYNLAVDNSSPSGYFSNSNLNAWELKYSLDNDTSRFVWADTESGKGVIYYMKDEFNNECPYDFKNIQFVRTADWFSNNNTWYESIFEENPQEDKWFYTFSWINENEGCEDLSIVGNTLYNDDEYISGVFGNKILECSNSNYFLYSDINNSLFALSKNIFVSSYFLYEDNIFYGCHSNMLSINCVFNTFGNICSSNTFGNDCIDNTFGNSCISNKFDNFCGFNTFSNNCGSNTFGENCRSNTFGNDCSDNTFGNSCSDNTFGNDCNDNIFGISCSSNAFGDDCSSNMFDNAINNTFGNNCKNNTIGTNCNIIEIDNNCKFNTFGNNCRCIKLITDNEAMTDEYHYYKFTSGLEGPSPDDMLEITLEPNLKYETKVAKRTNGEIVIYNEADLVPWTYISE